MKRLFVLMVISIFLSMAGTAAADNWYSTNQITIRWDATTTLINSDSIPEGDLVTYELYTKSVQTGIESLAGSATSALEYVITFINEGDYHIGIRAIRTIPAVGELPARAILGVIVWTSDPLVVKDSVTFGVSYYLHLSSASGLSL